MEYIPKYIVVHHSAADSPTPQFDAINEWHKARNFAVSNSGYFVGYHRVIEKDGTVRKAREDTERDCDALGHNFDSLSVCLAGNLDNNLPTAAQGIALVLLLDEWCRKFHIFIDDIYPHRHFNKTSCYGKNLSDEWVQLLCLKYQVSQLIARIEALQAP